MGDAPGISTLLQIFQHYWVTTNMAASEFVGLIIYARPGTSLILTPIHKNKRWTEKFQGKTGWIIVMVCIDMNYDFI